MNELVTVTHAPEETLALAARVGGLLRAGDVVALAGDLGAGKTVFAKGIGVALGITEPVTSPTFTVVREYPCPSKDRGAGSDDVDARPARLVHVDVYRLDRVQELHDVGWDEYLDGESVALVEWGDRVGTLLPLDRLDVRLELAGAGTPSGRGSGADDDALDVRVVTLVPHGASWAARADALAALVEVA
jgi:tRNA threonylcarbamoyladenosine biosynthesis protein TsaE